MRVVYGFDRIAVAVEGVDFLDPALADQGPGVRERGARLEVHPLDTISSPEASIYASRPVAAGRALCRVDLLESAPNAADRMHWHPAMVGGEPGDRVFDAELSGDPLGWVRRRLLDGTGFLRDAGITDPGAFGEDVRAMAGAADDIVDQTAKILDRARRDPWPSVTARDVRGMAAVG